MLLVAYGLFKARVETWLDSQNAGAAIKQVVMLMAMSTPVDGVAMVSAPTDFVIYYYIRLQQSFIKKANSFNRILLF